MKNIFSECGFEPPQMRYIRNDPRGAEYGYYEASKNQDGDYIVLRYDANDRIMYRIHMLTEYDFRAWVSETF